MKFASKLIHGGPVHLCYEPLEVYRSLCMWDIGQHTWDIAQHTQDIAQSLRYVAQCH